jgi:hypothetical protein
MNEPHEWVVRNSELRGAMTGTTRLVHLTFGKSLLHGLSNHLADAFAQDRIIVHWIEFIRRERLLRLQDRITGRTITVRVHG